MSGNCLAKQRRNCQAVSRESLFAEKSSLSFQMQFVEFIVRDCSGKDSASRFSADELFADQFEIAEDDLLEWGSGGWSGASCGPLPPVP